MEGTISLGIYDSAGKLVRVLHREAKGDEFVAALDGYITHWDGLDDAGHPLPPGHYSAGGYMVGAVTVRKGDTLRTHDIEPLAASGSNATSVATPVPQATLQSLTQTDLIESGITLKFPTGKPFVPQSKVRVGLVSNPLDRDRAGSAELSIGFDANGSWLQLADGLPLKQISATRNLKWAVLGRSAPGEPLIVFQSDGRPVQQIGANSGTDGYTASFQGDDYFIEEFAITGISNMMAFDCGGFDFTGPGN
jgi:hypothetical protein